MMKKAVIWLAVCLMSSMALAAPAFEKGKHYEVIADEKTSKPTVTEMFSFYCPACYRFEFIAKGIKKGLPAGVKFNKSHVDSMRQATPQTQQKLTRALVAAEKLKLGEKINDAIFKHIHQSRKAFAGDDDIRQLFIDNGVDGATFDKAYNSFTVKAIANKMKKYQDNLSRGNKLGGIPAVIVNGKYKLNRAELRNQQDYDNLIKYLLTLD